MPFKLILRLFSLFSRTPSSQRRIQAHGLSLSVTRFYFTLYLCRAYSLDIDNASAPFVNRLGQLQKVELDELHDQLSTVRDQIDAVGGISTVAAIQEALTQAENELDSVLHQFQAGSANMISVRVLIKKNVVRDFLSATDYFMSALVPGIRNGYL